MRRIEAPIATSSTPPITIHVRFRPVKGSVLAAVVAVGSVLDLAGSLVLAGSVPDAGVSLGVLDVFVGAVSCLGVGAVVVVGAGVVWL